MQSSWSLGRIWHLDYRTYFALSSVVHDQLLVDMLLQSDIVELANNTRGVTPIGAVSRAMTGVKMQSNGQGTFWGRSNSQAVCWGTIYGTTCNQEAWPILFVHAQLINGQGSRAKIRCG